VQHEVIQLHDTEDSHQTFCMLLSINCFRPFAMYYMHFIAYVKILWGREIPANNFL